MAIDKKKLQELIDYRSGKTPFCEMIEKDKSLGIDIAELGITQEDLQNPIYHHPMTDEDYNIKHFATQENFAILTLYQYTSNVYGASDVGANTRDFCKRVVARTKVSLMRFQDIVRLNSQNAGFGKGGSNTYSVFRYRGGSNCKHIWKKFLFDNISNKLIEAPSSKQPLNVPV